MTVANTTNPAPTTVQVAIADIKQAAVSQLVTSLTGLLQGAEADIQNFVTGMTSDAVDAAAAGDQTVLDSLADDMKVVMEINRIRFAESAQSSAISIVGTVLGVVVKILASAVVV